MAATLSGCFTGIESTPKITANDVKRENIVERREDTYLSDILPQPLPQWTKGKEFYVSDDKFSLLLQPSQSAIAPHAGDRIFYESEREITDIKGDRLLELTFVDGKGSQLVYRHSQSEDESMKAPSIKIPFLIEMSVVDAVKKRLTGNRYFVTTSAWYDTEGKSRTGRKYVPVTVTDVQPGNSYYSAILCLDDENGKPFKFFLSVGDDLKALRHFGAMFSLDDPRKSYPQITDENWRNIINGRVAENMTRDECRLALGSPATVDRRAGYSSLREVWTYENGIYLIFEDGLLKTFRQ